MVLDTWGPVVSERLPEIVVYTQPHCASCKEVARFPEDPVALEEITSRGYMSPPVTRIGDHWVAGVKRKQLERLL